MPSSLRADLRVQLRIGRTYTFDDVWARNGQFGRLNSDNYWISVVPSRTNEETFIRKAYNGEHLPKYAGIYLGHDTVRITRILGADNDLNSFPLEGEKEV